MISFLSPFILSFLLVCASTNGLSEISNIKASEEITISGFSSGGAMATQMLVAHSSVIKGAGIFAAPPYFCTRGIIANMKDCITNGFTVFVAELILAAQGFENFGLIDKLSNLQNSKVYFFSGELDSVVWPGVVKDNENFFRKLGADVQSEYGLAAEHNFPTDFFGHKCSNLGKPFINNCDFKGSKNLLEHVMDHSLEPKIDYKEKNLKSFDQKKYNPGVTSSLANSGMIYIPDKCNDNECSLHVVFHGCSQTVSDIGLNYIYGTGYLGLAESNNIILLFPQIEVSKIYPYNPYGCWDWWGYSEMIPTSVQWNFPTKTGTQIRAVYSMMTDIMAGSFTLHQEFAFRDTPRSSY